ncbi:hypothetical protein [Halalkalicoccus sp. NIPERK01]|uniref:DUF7529 family protein n=1 Tax=Halalkalicoccus sp. NIPERK01 TaxID=3053469 RepID=UPI00256EC470|nr:hypothetical protein [Halalkalicoccus sp. NIPERK01]MDL5362101.1 hypothetical protein [Halalkalicoccus sp. NIPERK01]
MRGADRATRVAGAHWETLLEESRALAAEFEDEGWETLVVQSGTVTPVSERDRCGLDVLVPGNQYDPLAEWVADGVEFPRSEVYCREEGEVVLLVVVMRDPDAEKVVVFPAYYGRAESEGVFERAREEGELNTYLRKLNGETVVFSHDDPAIFRP